MLTLQWLASSSQNETPRRVLRLDDMRPYSFMPLAGPQLWELTCWDVQEAPLTYAPDIEAIARLTGLTRLELVSYDCAVSFSPLQHLGLIELVLVDCPYIPENLFIPGALTDLQKLHMADLEPPPSPEEFNRDLQTPGSEGYLAAHELRHLGAIVLRLPKLFQLSGRCSLLSVGMADALSASGWHKHRCKRGSMTNLEWHGDSYMWTKPQ